MSLVWPLWLVFCCVAVLVAIFKPTSAALKPMAAVGVLGWLTFFVWLTDGRLAAFMGLGVVLAYPVLMVIVMKQGGAANVPAPFLRLAATRLLVPALVMGGLIGAGIELGGAFVVWRACLGGALVLAAGIAFFVRATRQA